MKMNITETVLRDAQQSLMATRMPLSDFEDALDKMDAAGYYSIECRDQLRSTSVRAMSTTL